jgi:uncharacterized protein
MTPSFGPLSDIVLQGTSLCNLNCSYCYLEASQRKQNQLLKLEVVSKVIERVLECESVCPEVQLLWHAGEP